MIRRPSARQRIRSRRNRRELFARLRDIAIVASLAVAGLPVAGLIGLSGAAMSERIQAAAAVRAELAAHELAERPPFPLPRLARRAAGFELVATVRHVLDHGLTADDCRAALADPAAVPMPDDIRAAVHAAALSCERVD